MYDILAGGKKSTFRFLINPLNIDVIGIENNKTLCHTLFTEVENNSVYENRVKARILDYFTGNNRFIGLRPQCGNHEYNTSINI